MKVNADQSMQLATLGARSAREDGAIASQNTHDRAEIKQLAEEFESLFLGLVLKSMRDTVPKGGLMNGGHAEEVYRGMLDQEYSKIMAADRHTGLADNIEKFLLEAYNTTENPGLEAAKVAGHKAYKAEGLRSDGKNAKMVDGTMQSLTSEVK